MASRAKASAPLSFASISNEDFVALRAACTDSQHWSKPPDAVKQFLANFKREIKQHFFIVQLRRCCYCSFELQQHQRTYDLEHVLARDGFKQFMFEISNLAAACTLCNGSKKQKGVLSAGLHVELTELPRDTDAYLIVHPHFDEWNDHLAFDGLGRIICKDESVKGKNTINICGLEKLNAVRLADSFGPSGWANAERMLRDFSGATEPALREQVLLLLRELASSSGLESAKAVVAHLETNG